jgi:hypothetical protein
MSQPDRVPAIFYNPQPRMDNCQPDLFFMFDGCRVGLLFQTSLYAQQPTAEELLKPGIKY